jgi:hypothetical protein
VNTVINNTPIIERCDHRENPRIPLREFSDRALAVESVSVVLPIARMDWK